MIKEARLVICSGSTSSSHQALAQGRPVLGIVSNMNQHLNMQAVEQAKAGRFTRAGTIESRSLGDLALSFLARPSYTEAAQALARTLARYDAVTRLQDLLSRIPVHTSSAVL